MLQFKRENWYYTNQPLSIASNTMIQLSELEQSRLKKYSKVLKSLHIFRILVILVERPKLYDWITAFDKTSYTYHNYQYLLFLLIIIVQLFFYISDVLRENTSLKGIYHFHLTWQAE